MPDPATPRRDGAAPPAWLLFAAISAASIAVVVLVIAGQ